MNPNVGVVVMAAGKGARMFSESPKVLRAILGEPMLWYVYDQLEQQFAGRIHTVIGFRAGEVEAAFPGQAGRFVLQEPQLGTGHALQCAWKHVVNAGYEYVLVINGDTPLVPAALYAELTERALAAKADLACVTLTLAQRNAFGRVLRHPDGSVAAVIEAKDYDAKLHGKNAGEVNAGIYLFKTESIGPLLDRLTNDNKSHEYYVTDLIGLAVSGRLTAAAYNFGDAPELMGVNSPLDLAGAEELLRRRIVADWREQGVIVRQADSVRIGPKAAIAPGVEITGPAEIYGETRIAAGVIVASHTVLRDCAIAEGARIDNFSHCDGSLVGPGCTVGPYGRLRPGSVLERGAHVGNFVEVKKSVLHAGVKANHLSYLGDAEIGAGTNIGAGTITCNYDGKSKHKTAIGERVFIGSNTALVAPVSVGDDALVAAGSTITKDVAPGALAFGRARQETRPRRKIKP
ncbi:MAG: bifunctional UDP-N-acetylglucosamine diphosphorylase/glucosamine-1-phosphate N-acetyltransferase GlmU [Desulfovibrionaceae bacterium]|nr:bifunctional UDP-N-acetylglucosamine diphosphorylase/glucosamine-1-phosphate N-acetyltransferase GlmU [Desulfovibrionaceae bacterium]MBF0513011.1 bifunctional UDP-N-acetylglucosamine diphosphorylase/glucosamine-1-phosphate N-acetyltransferase GlmU [Desulfovibrionaceae bacterium]